MDNEGMAHLLEERKDYMMQQCPAYRLDCIVQDALYDILSNWNYGFGVTFRVCAELLRQDGLRQCLENYEFSKELSLNPSILEAIEMAVQEDVMAQMGIDEEAMEAYKRLELAARLEGEPLEQFTTLYLGVISDRVDFECMYCCIFGAEAVEADEQVVTWLREIVEPNKGYTFNW